MATDRSSARGREGRTGGLLRERSHLFRVGAAFFAVIGVLILGAILKNDDRVLDAPPPEARPFGDAVPAAVSAPDLPAAAPRMEPALALSTASPDALAGLLDRRTEADRRRLGLVGSGFTLQLAAVCDPANAMRWLEQAGSAPELHLLATTIEGRPCYRVCWGHFSRSSEAERAGLPATVRAFASDPPRAVPIAQVLP